MREGGRDRMESSVLHQKNGFYGFFSKSAFLQFSPRKILVPETVSEGASPTPQQLPNPPSPIPHSNNNPLRPLPPLINPHTPQPGLPQQRPPLRLRTLHARAQHHHLHIHERRKKRAPCLRQHDLGDDKVRVAGRHGGGEVREDAQAGGVREVVEDGVEVVEAGAWVIRRDVSKGGK